MIDKSKAYNRYLFFVFIFYIFLTRDFLEQNISCVGYFDELIAVFAIPLFVIELRNNFFVLRYLKNWGYARYILACILIGLLSSMIYQYQDLVRIVLPDMLICTKFWLAIYVGKKIWAEMDLSFFATRIYRHVKMVTIIYVLLVIVDCFFHIFPSDIRYGIRSTQLMYPHPTSFAACCMVLLMVLVSLKNYIHGYKKWICILLMLLCSTLRSKAWGGAFVVVLICYFVFVRKKEFRLRTMLLFLPLIVFVGWEQIEYYFLGDMQNGSARYQLTRNAFHIANDYFPIGAGFGTYGSYYSGVEYSEIYSKYGLDKIWGISGDNKSFISDSFWPMILGQFGYFGFLFYVLAVYSLYKVIRKLRNVNAAYYASALCGLCYLIVSSTAEASFVNPIAVSFALYMGILIAQIDINNLIKNDKTIPTLEESDL